MFQKTVWDHYRLQGRHELPWRLPNADGSFDAYKITVSEIMLQQTQVPRVVPKFSEFITRFPDVQSLAAAPLGEVLACWSGLGYNRRAKFLWQTARTVARDFAGVMPDSRQELITLPGIGPNTAGAILVYAHNQPHIFIETNIRTVFIYHFFTLQQHVSDKSIAKLVEATLPAQNVREWYWALMDYGTYLKQSVGNLSRQSRHFTKQSQFEGSRRQVRGQVIKMLAQKDLPEEQLRQVIIDPRLPDVLSELVQEGLVERVDHTYMLPRV